MPTRSGPIICTAIVEDCTLWSCVTPDFSRSFVDAIKGVPADYRSWDPSRKAWIVAGDWIQHVADLAKAAFPASEVQMVDWEEEV